jgi:hypothetical protein
MVAGRGPRIWPASAADPPSLPAQAVRSATFAGETLLSTSCHNGTAVGWPVLRIPTVGHLDVRPSRYVPHVARPVATHSERGGAAFFAGRPRYSQPRVVHSQPAQAVHLSSGLDIVNPHFLGVRPQSFRACRRARRPSLPEFRQLMTAEA